MKRCTKCWMPDTRPGSRFVDGMCQACINHEAREQVNWEARWQELRILCNEYRHREPYNCLIPVSGGKDSYTLVKIMVEDMDMNPLLVTVGDPFTKTEAGKDNLLNLRDRYKLNHWLYQMSPDLFKRATRYAFEETGEPLKFIEYAIYTIPTHLAQSMSIPLVMFGEDSAYEYGSSDIWESCANERIKAMVKQCKKDEEWWEAGGITEIDSILPLKYKNYPHVMFMSYFYKWSSYNNLNIAKERGFHDLGKEWHRKGTMENFEQIDSVGYMVHLWMKYPKFGFQRVSDIASRRVRDGLIELAEAKEIIEGHDYRIDPWSLKDFCRVCDYTTDEFYKIAKKFDRMGVL